MPNCTGLQEDQDIAGIGVRSAFYVQSFLTVVAATFPDADLKGSFWTLTVTAIAVVVSAGVQIVIGNLSFYNAILVMHLGVLHNIASSVVASIYRSGHVDRTLGPDVTADVERDGESSEPLPAHVHAMRYRTVLSMVQKQLALPLYLQHIVVWGFCFIVCFLPTSSWNQSECASSTHLLFFGVSIAAPRSRKLMAVSMSLVFVLTIILALPGVIGVIFFTIRLWMERSHRFRSLIKSDRGASVAFLGPIFLSAWVYIVVTVETTIRLNPVITGGTVWTFGQIFPLVSILIPSVTIFFALEEWNAGRRV